MTVQCRHQCHILWAFTLCCGEVQHCVACMSASPAACCGCGPESERCTPHPSTSTVRQRHLAAPRSRFSEQELLELELVVRRSWRVLYLAPLWQLRLDQERSLRRLASGLRDRLAAQPGLPANLKVDHRIIRVLSDVGLSSDSQVPTVLFSVRSGAAESDHGKPAAPPPLAEVLLCSDPQFSRRMAPVALVGDYVCLSVALTRGLQQAVDAIMDELRLTYGGTSVPADFSQDEMRWMSAMWANGRDLEGRRPGNTEDDGAVGRSDQVALVWEPYRDSQKQPPLTIRCAMSAQQMDSIWHRVRADSPVLKRDEMTQFYLALSRLMLQDTGLTVCRMQLTLLETPHITVKQPGSVKFSSADVVPRCVALFREFSREFYTGGT